MTPLEQKLLLEACEGREPRLLIRSSTRVDVGRWWRSNSLWLCIDRTDLVLFAVARRKYLERVPFTDCQASYYNHAAGELMIKPTEKLRFGSFALTPREALSVLDTIKQHPQNT